ncbi:MAG: hypothetical protein ACOC7J_05235, partial [Armatimonadota bacterium]
MRTVLTCTLLLACCASAFAAPAISERPLLLAESFEGDLDGWLLQLNRGAEGTMETVEDAVLG